MSFDEWLRLAERIGFPIVILMLVALGVLRGSYWLAAYVVLPVTRETISLIQTLRDHVPKNTDALEAIAERLGAVERKTTAFVCRAGDGQQRAQGG